MSTKSMYLKGLYRNRRNYCVYEIHEISRDGKRVGARDIDSEHYNVLDLIDLERVKQSKRPVLYEEITQQPFDDEQPEPASLSDPILEQIIANWPIGRLPSGLPSANPVSTTPSYNVSYTSS